MGTKQHPGSFDCLAAALPDEPMFVLLARDPLAGFLVSIWSKVRYGDWEAAHAVFDAMLSRAGPPYIAEPDVDKAGEAIDCAMSMFAWRAENDGRWRDQAARSDG